MNPYAILAAILLGMGSIVGAFFYGEHVQKSADVAAQQSVAADAFAKRVTQSLSINDAFASIDLDLHQKQAETQAEAQTRTIYVDRVIHEKPLPAICTLDPELVRLRCEANAALYRAAGEPVPGRCPGESTPATTGSTGQPGG